MSDINHWTDLPEGMQEDFVSIEGDYDFPFYLSEKEEWMNYKYLEKSKGKVTVSEPCLIMELNRLVPYIEDKHIKFHPLNMPYIKIGKTEIVGFVIGISEDTKYYEYQGNVNNGYITILNHSSVKKIIYQEQTFIVDDGTGTINIMYEKNKFAIDSQKRYEIDKKYNERATNIDIKLLKSQVCPSKFLNPRPQFNYPSGTSIRDMAVFEHNWSLETGNGFLGKKITHCDYVHAVGYCALDFCFNKKPCEEITFKDLCITKLNFLATTVRCIDEFDYNKKLHTWLHTVVQRRYTQC